MCFCIFTLVFTYMMSVPNHQCPPPLWWCCDGDRCSAQGCVPPNARHRHIHLFINHLLKQYTVHAQAVKQYTSQPSVYCLYRLYHQQRSHFFVYKNKTKNLKKTYSYLSTFKWSKKRDKVAINGGGFQEYRLQYKNVVQVVAHEACMCLCCPAHP